MLLGPGLLEPPSERPPERAKTCASVIAYSVPAYPKTPSSAAVTVPIVRPSRFLNGVLTGAIPLALPYSTNVRPARLTRTRTSWPRSNGPNALRAAAGLLSWIAASSAGELATLSAAGRAIRPPESSR